VATSGDNALKTYKGKPVQITAGEIVAVVEHDRYDGYSKVKVKGGGRLFSIDAHQEPKEGDYLIIESGTGSDGYLCPREIFLQRYEEAEITL